MPQKSAYPAHAQKLNDDEDDKPLVRLDRNTVFKGEDDKPLVQPASRSETVEAWISRKTQSSYTVTKKKRTSSLARSVCHIWTGCVRNIAWAIKRSLKRGQKSDRAALQNIKKQVDGCVQPERPSPEALPHVFCTIQEENNSQDIPEKVDDLYPQVVKTCHSAIRRSRDQIDHVWVESQQRSLEISFSWVMVLQRLETKPLDVWLFWMVLLRIQQHVNVRVPLR